MAARRALTILGLLLACASAPALAYIPHPGWLMERMAEKRGNLRLQRLRVELRCGTGEQARTELLLLKQPGLVRRERGDGSLEVCDKGKCRRRSADGTIGPLPEWTYLQYLYFVEAGASGERYERLLASLKVDTRVDTLSRLSSRVAIVLGAKERERDRPQFWLDKDLYLPLRLMVRDGGSIVDLVWRDWGSRQSGEWFPGALEVSRDGQPLEVCETLGVEADRDLPDDLFQLPAAR
jgi:hypothetical protein